MGNINYCMKRAWKRFLKKSIILKRYLSESVNGPLNAVKDITYNPVKIEHCDIKRIPFEKKETEGGVVIGGDTTIGIHRAFYTGVIGEKDMVNIGGTIEGGAVTGGVDYNIIDITEDGMIWEIVLERVKF